MMARFNILAVTREPTAHGFLLARALHKLNLFIQSLAVNSPLYLRNRLEGNEAPMVPT